MLIWSSFQFLSRTYLEISFLFHSICSNIIVRFESSSTPWFHSFVRLYLDSIAGPWWDLINCGPKIWYPSSRYISRTHVWVIWMRAACKLPLLMNPSRAAQSICGIDQTMSLKADLPFVRLCTLVHFHGLHPKQVAQMLLLTAAGSEPCSSAYMTTSTDRRMSVLVSEPHRRRSTLALLSSVPTAHALGAGPTVLPGSGESPRASSRKLTRLINENRRQ